MKINATQWPQLSSLLDTALELTVDERMQWLEALPEELSELKPTLRELLAQTAGVETKDFLDRPPDFAAALIAEHAHVQWAEHEFQVDKIIGAYRLLRELGRGGMGTVWLAERVDGKLKRQVALKFPYAGPNQRQLAERLAREREILAGLEHCNIARLYDADITSSGQPFLVLEYVDGVPLNEYCDQQQLTTDERLKLFQQVLEAVRYAHSHLVIHRDLKPSNILITADGVAHLLDFGIAKLTVDGEVKETALTQISGRALTPDYASPEQLTGEAITTVSDVYSLGVLLYELLTGTRPYRLQRNTRNALEEAIERADIVLPSRAEIITAITASRKTSIRQLRKTLTGDLDTLILKALKRNPTERYASADAFFDDVNRYIHQQPILAQSDTQWYRVKKFVARNRLVVVSVATIALALLLGTGAALWQAHQAKLQRDRAVASAARSEAVTDFLQLMVTEVADADEPITMQQLIARSEDIANRTYSTDANERAAILSVLGDYNMTFDHMDIAEKQFTKALELTTVNTDKAFRAKLLCSSGAALYELGNPELARQQIESGVNLSADNAATQAMCLENRAFHRYVLNDIGGMLDDIRLAQRGLQLAGIKNPEFDANLLSDIALGYSELGRVGEAERYYAKAIELLASVGRGETNLAMQIENSWAVAHDTSGDPLGALAHYDKAIAIAHKRSVGASHEDKFAANRAYALHLLSRDTEALDGYRRGIRYSEKSGDLTTALSNKLLMAGVLLALGNVDEAKRLIDKITPAVNRDMQNKESLELNLVAFRGALALKQQHYPEAIAEFSEVIDFLNNRNMRNGRLSYRLRLRGDAYLAIKEFSSAFSDANQAYDIARKVQAEMPCSVLTGDAALLLAKIHQAQGHQAEARKWTELAVTQLQGSVGAEHPTTLEAKHLLEQYSHS